MKTSRVSAKLKAAARRLTAGLICVCIVLSMADIALPALAYDFKGDGNPKSGTTVMEYLVRAWHSDSQTDAVELKGCIYQQYNDDYTCEGTFEEGSPNFDSEAGTITIKPEDFEITGEEFLGFAISTGQDAASIDENGNLVIKYTPNVHIVKAHAFFKNAGVQVAGSADAAVYGESVGSENHEQDTALAWGYPEGTTETGTNADLAYVPITDGDGDYIMKSSDPAGSQAQARVNERLTAKDITINGSTDTITDWTKTELTDAKVYKTTLGLHTDKTVSVLSEEDREYQIDLESWFVGNNKANVGLILDASGSMAFSSMGTEDDKIFRKISHTDGKMFEGRNPPGTDADIALENVKVKMDGVTEATDISDKLLTNTEVNAILNSANPSEESNTGINPTENTDNSSLGYTGYNYYIFDKRSSTNEYVPIGYWDGTSDSLKLIEAGSSGSSGSGGSGGGGGGSSSGGETEPGGSTTPSTGMPGYSTDPAKNHLIGYYDFQKEESFVNNSEPNKDTARTWGINRAPSSTEKYAEMIDAVSAEGTINFSASGEKVTDEDYANTSSAVWNNFNWDTDYGFNVSYVKSNNNLLKKALLLNGELNTADHKNFTVSFTLSSEKKYGRDETADKSKTNDKEDQILYIGPLNNPDKQYVNIYRASESSDPRLKIGSGGSGTKGDIYNEKVFETIVDKNTPMTYTLTFEYASSGETNVKVYVDGKIVVPTGKGAGADGLNIALPENCRVILGGLKDNYDGQDLYVDNVYIFNEALTSTEVKTLYDDYQNNAEVKKGGETQAQPWTISAASTVSTVSAPLSRIAAPSATSSDGMPGYSANSADNHLVSYYDFQKNVLFYGGTAHPDDEDNARTWGINRTKMDTSGKPLSGSGEKYAKMIDAVNANSINFDDSGAELDDEEHPNNKNDATWNNFNWDDGYGLNVSYEKANTPLSKALLLDGALNTTDHKNFTVSFTLSSAKRYGEDKTDKEGGNNSIDQILYIGPLSNTGTNYVNVYRDDKTSDTRLKIGSGGNGEKSDIYNQKDFNDIVDKNKPITYTLTFEYDEIEDKIKVKVYINGKLDTANPTGVDIALPENCRVILGGLTDEYDGQDLYVDNVYIFDTALTSGEVKTLYDDYQNDDKVKTTGKEQAMPWTITPKADLGPEVKKDDVLYFTVGGSESATAMLQNEISKTDPKDRAGWYYVTSTSQWEKILKVGTAKNMDALRNDIKYEEETNMPYYFDGNTDEYDDEVDGKLNSEIAPNGTPTGGYYYYRPKQFEPLKFFLDEEGHLCCFYGSGNATMDANGWSHVYMKKNTARTKVEVLQHALGRFVTKLKENTPSSTIGAVRFSTQRYTSTSDTFADHPDEYEKFKLLDWTDNAKEALSILNNERGNSGDGVEANDDGQYNYVLTGNTSTAAGFTTYAQCLADGVDKNDVNTKKYLIVFTDGKDTDYATYENNLQNHPAVAAAREYREGNDEYTVIAVMLAGGTVAEGSPDYNSALTFLAALTGEYTGNTEDEAQLKAPANKEDKGNGNYQYVYVGHGSEELEDVFETIGEEIADDLDDYVVQDYIDPRFDLVDAYGSVWTLGNDGNVTVRKMPWSAAPQTAYDGFTQDTEDENVLTKTIAGTEETITLRTDRKIEGAESKLYYDSREEMYYLKWEGVKIPGCTEGDAILPVWNAQITVKAKDDFIGGNTILTNGDSAMQNYVYPDSTKITVGGGNSDDTPSSSGTVDDQRNPQTGNGSITNYPSKGFPRTAVNVGATKPEIKDGVQVLFMGDKLTNEDVAKKLGDNVEAKRYWDYLKLYAEYEHASDSSKYNPTGVSESPFDMLIEELVKSPTEVTYPYYYFTSVGDATAAGATAAQSGTTPDKLGDLTFKWEDVAGYAEYPTDGITKDANPRRSQLTVKYTPVADRTTAAKAEVKDEDYEWDDTFKPADGSSEVTGEITGPYTTNIVSGEIAFEMELSADVVKHLQTYVPGQTVTYKAELVKKDASGAETTIGTYTAEYKVPTEPDANPAAVAVPAKIEYTDDTYTNYGLPKGDYEVRPIGGSGFGITFDTEIKNVTLTGSESGFTSFDAAVTKTAVEMESSLPTTGTHTAADFAAEIVGGTIKIGQQTSNGIDYRDRRYAMAKISSPSIDKNALSISKKVVGAPVTTDEFEFTITLDDVGTETYTYNGNPTTVNGDAPTTKQITFTDGVATVTLKDAEWITIQNISAGTEYTVSEVADSDYITTVAGDETGTISATDTNSVAYTNTYNGTTPVDTGTLIINKKVVNPPATAETYTFTVNSDPVKTVTIEGSGNKTLELEPGTYTVTETAGDFTTTVDGAETSVAEVIVTAGDSAEVTFTNTYKKADPPAPNTGTLTINKVVTGDDVPTADVTYTFEVSDGSETRTTTITGSGSTELELEPGTYTVTESTTGDFETTYEVGGTTTGSSAVVTIVGGDTVAVTVTNTYGSTEPGPGPSTTVTLTYDANSGTGDVPPTETHDKGAHVTLADGDSLTHDGAVFLGWSLKQNDVITSQSEEDSAGIITEIESLDADTVVYAVWAEDKKGGPGDDPDEPGDPANPDGVPDYQEVTLTYDANGGAGDVPRAKMYRKGTNVPLTGGNGLTFEKAVFIGWSLTKQEIITSSEDEDKAGIIFSIDSIEADTTVYAVWAIDNDGTGTPDYDEVGDKVKLTYDPNGGTGNVPRTRAYDRGAHVTLASGGGMILENAVFIGWSLAKQGIITSQSEEDEAGIINTVNTVTLNEDTTVYAVWAIDVKGGPGKNPDPTKPGDPSNPNKIPDYKQATLTYDPNGGEGDAPSARTVNKGAKVTLVSAADAQEKLTRYGAVLLGWSLVPHEGIITSQAEESSVTMITEIDSLDADTTVYAVWAIDEKWGPGTNPDPNEPVDPGTNPSNPSGVPDYRETDPEQHTQFHLDANGGKFDDGSGTKDVTDPQSSTDLPTPTRDGYEFKGWTEDGEPFDPSTADLNDGKEHNLEAQWEKISSGGDTPPAPSGGGIPTAPPTIDRTEHYGYIIGVTADEVRPEQNITRAEVATILFRLLTDEAREANWSEVSGFVDVQSGAWYNHAVAVLHNMGIIEGDETGRFEPNAMITRAELAAMIGRFYEETEGTVLSNRFADVNEANWYAREVLLTDYYGLMQGDGDQFRPEDLLTRAEAIAVFNRLLGRTPHEDHLSGNMIVWTDNTDKRKWYYADIQEATNSHECVGNVIIDGETCEAWESVKAMRDWAAMEY